jgi:hypothetical protein
VLGQCAWRLPVWIGRQNSRARRGTPARRNTTGATETAIVASHPCQHGHLRPGASSASRAFTRAHCGSVRTRPPPAGRRRSDVCKWLRRWSSWSGPSGLRRQRSSCSGPLECFHTTTTSTTWSKKWPCAWGTWRMGRGLHAPRTGRMASHAHRREARRRAFAPWERMTIIVRAACRRACDHTTGPLLPLRRAATQCAAATTSTSPRRITHLQPLPVGHIRKHGVGTCSVCAQRRSAVTRAATGLRRQARAPARCPTSVLHRMTAGAMARGIGTPLCTRTTGACRPVWLLSVLWAAAVTRRAAPVLPTAAPPPGMGCHAAAWVNVAARAASPTRQR